MIHSIFPINLKTFTTLLATFSMIHSTFTM